MHWYEIDGIEKLDSPALVIYPERVRENISTIVSMVGDAERLRPHVKTHKTIEVSQMMMDAGINKFKCATIAEAEMLVKAGATDILLAYQPVGPKVNRFADLIKKNPNVKFSCLTDSRDAAAAMAKVFSSAGLNVAVYLDINVGMNRTGIAPGSAALDLYRYCASLDGIFPVGLHAYDGHQRSKNFEERELLTNEGFEPVEEMARVLSEEGFEEPILIAGGTPTFPVHAKKTNRICSPGTFVFWDACYLDLCAEQPLQPAALVISRVISHPSLGRICADLGHKSVAAENELSKRVFFLNVTGLRPVGQSEEHLVLETDGEHEYGYGDVLYGLPYHICPTVALYERAITVEDHEVTGEWKIVARDRRLG